MIRSGPSTSPSTLGSLKPTDKDAERARRQEALAARPKLEPKPLTRYQTKLKATMAIKKRRAK